MQGVQGTWKSGRTRTAAYEDYSILGKCPECREGLVYAGEERTELTCSYCGIVVSKADHTQGDGSSAPSVSKCEPLGSYIVADTESAPSLKGAGIRVGEADAQSRRERRTAADVYRADEQDCREAVSPEEHRAERRHHGKEAPPKQGSLWGDHPVDIRVPLLYACRAAGIAHISHREVLQAYTDAGYRVREVGAAEDRPGVWDAPAPSDAGGLREGGHRQTAIQREDSRATPKGQADPKEYFTTLFERAKELVGSAAEPNGFNPRTVAAGSVYLASLAIRPKTFTQREAGEVLGIEEYTVREYCCRRLNEAQGNGRFGPLNAGRP